MRRMSFACCAWRRGSGRPWLRDAVVVVVRHAEQGVDFVRRLRCPAHSQRPITLAGHLRDSSHVVGRGVDVKTIYAAANIPPPPTYPRQDVLIVRASIAEAAGSGSGTICVIGAAGS